MSKGMTRKRMGTERSEGYVMTRRENIKIIGINWGMFSWQMVLALKLDLSLSLEYHVFDGLSKTHSPLQSHSNLEDTQKTKPMRATYSDTIQKLVDQLSAPLCTQRHTYIYTHPYIHIHAHTHTYIHTYIYIYI